MNVQSRQIEVYSGNSLQGQLGGNLIQGQLGGSLGQAMGCTPLNTWPQCYSPLPSPRLPRDFELVIEKVGSEIVLDYGAKLRLLIADPIKGIDLREAIQKLKDALRCFNPRIPPMTCDPQSSNTTDESDT
jgi:hypothetical protein